MSTLHLLPQTFEHTLKIFQFPSKFNMYNIVTIRYLDYRYDTPVQISLYLTDIVVFPRLI